MLNINVKKIAELIQTCHLVTTRDLAKLYGCKNGTKTINLAVKRNIERFPNDFYFQLTQVEFDNLKFQFETSSWNTYGGIRKLPYIFTEQGVAMLATVLRTSIASEVSINIMRAFVTMRKYIGNNLIKQKYINNQVMKNTEDIKLLQESFSKLEEKKKINEIYFNGQIYDAYSKIVDIMKESKQELIIIDRYADKTVLDMISKVEVIVKLITKKNGLLSKLDIEKYQKQYDNLKIKYDDTFHDRYIIVDKEIFYHLGASVNHVGSRTFSINILEDDCMKKFLLAKLIYSEF